MQQLILASTSPYRKELLSRLGIAFQQWAPQCNEDDFKAQIKDPHLLAKTLARKKAESLLAPATTGNPIIIGGDQIVALENEIIGKSGSSQKAEEQLWKMQGKTHELITAIAVVTPERNFEFTDVTRLTMRKLSREQIKRYINADQPFDCAGSYKIEKLGISLFEKIESADFTAIQGIPLIELANVLIECGLQVP